MELPKGRNCVSGCWLKWQMTHDTWHMTHDTWHMTHDTVVLVLYHLFPFHFNRVLVDTSNLKMTSAILIRLDPVSIKPVLKIQHFWMFRLKWKIEQDWRKTQKHYQSLRSWSLPKPPFLILYKLNNVYYCSCNNIH